MHRSGTALQLRSQSMDLGSADGPDYDAYFADTHELWTAFIFRFVS